MIQFILNLFKRKTSIKHISPEFAKQLKVEIENGREVWIEKDVELHINYKSELFGFIPMNNLFNGTRYEEINTYWKEGKVDRKEFVSIFVFQSKAEILQWLLDNKLRIERR